MFEADPRIRHLPAPYARGGTLRDRLASLGELWLEDGIVIDPDSRLTPARPDLGMRRGTLLLFRQPGVRRRRRRAACPTLAARWAGEMFGVSEARPYIAPLPATEPPAEITVSLGVGENPAKTHRRRVSKAN